MCVWQYIIVCVCMANVYKQQFNQSLFSKYPSQIFLLIAEACLFYMHRCVIQTYIIFIDGYFVNHTPTHFSEPYGCMYIQNHLNMYNTDVPMDPVLCSSAGCSRSSCACTLWWWLLCDIGRR